MPLGPYFFNLAINCKVVSAFVGRERHNCSKQFSLLFPMTHHPSATLLGESPWRYAGSPPRPPDSRSIEGYSLERMKGLLSLGIRCLFRAGKTAFPARGRLCSLLYWRVFTRSIEGSPLGRVCLSHSSEVLGFLGANTNSSLRILAKLIFSTKRRQRRLLMPLSDVKGRRGVIGEGKNHRSERGFVPSPKKHLSSLQFIANQKPWGS